MFSLMPRRRERTALARWEPFETLRREFAPFFELPRWAMRPLWEPEPFGLEMEEREGEVVYRAEVPGFELGEVEVTVSGNMMTIRAEHTEPAGKEGEVKERRHARFVETVTLPPGVEPEKIEARYHSGVLEVHVPRTPEAKPRRIEVKT